MDKKDKFLELWLDAGGEQAEKGTLKKIAEQIEVPEGTIRRWKSEHLKKNNMNVRRTFGKDNHEQSDKKVIQDVVRENVEKKLKQAKELTEKELLFCLYYIQDFNAGLAVKKAGYNTNNPYVIGCQLLKKKHIKKYLGDLKEQMSNEFMIDINRVLDMFNRIAFYDINDYFELKTFKQVIKGAYGRPEKDGNGEVLTEEIQVLTLKEDSDGQVISGISQKDGQMKIEMPDRLKALEFLAKFLTVTTKVDKEKITLERQKLLLEKKKNGMILSPEEEAEIEENMNLYEELMGD